MNGVEPSPSAPEDFTAFVAAYADEVRTAFLGLTGNDRLIDTLQRDVFAAVGMRWWWLRRRPRKPDGPDPRVAHLRRVLRREAASWPGELDGATVGGPTVVPSGGQIAPAVAELAARAWQRSGRMRSRRRLIAAGVVAAIAVLVVAAPRHPPQPVDDQANVDESPLPIALPPSVVVIPAIAAIADLPARATPVPGRFRLDPAAAQPLGGGRPGRAAALLQYASGDLVAVAADASTWRIDAAGLGGGRMLSTSLAPDGTRAVLATPTGLLLVNMGTGALKPIEPPFVPTVPSLVWTSPNTVLVQGANGAFNVDVDSAKFVAITGLSGADTIAMTGDARGELVELLAADAASGRGARIRTWPAGPQPQADEAEVVPISAPPWMSLWSGSGIGNPLLLIRACDAAAMRLPAEVGTPREAVCVVDRRGLALKSLVTAHRGSQLEPLAWLDDGIAVVRLTASPGGRSWLLAWDIKTGRLGMVAVVDGVARVALPDLAATPGR